jgi:hypothetical protein
VAHSQTGLVADWHKWNGGRSEGMHSNAYYYSYDACRIPWRIAIDYLWNGNQKAKAWCTKVSNWAMNIGPANIRSGYNLDGSNPGEFHNMSFVGAFTVGAMCNSQEVLDSFSAEMTLMEYDPYWYHAYLGNCYLLTLTGNMWRIDLVEKQASLSRALPSAGGDAKISLGPNRKLIVSGLPQAHSVSLRDIFGRRIAQSSNIVNGRLSLDIASVSRGCYFVHAAGKSGRLVHYQKLWKPSRRTE